MIQNGHANKGSCETQDTNNTAGDDIDIGLLEDAEIIDDEEQPDYELIQRNKAQYELKKLKNQNHISAFNASGDASK